MYVKCDNIQVYQIEIAYRSKDFHALENLDHHTQSPLVPMQAFRQKCSIHHSDSADL